MKVFFYLAFVSLVLSDISHADQCSLSWAEYEQIKKDAVNLRRTEISQKTEKFLSIPLNYKLKQLALNLRKSEFVDQSFKKKLNTILRDINMGSIDDELIEKLNSMVPLAEFKYRGKIKKLAKLTEATYNASFYAMTHPQLPLLVAGHWSSRKAINIWQQDYLGAWRSGKNLPDKIYRFAKRSVIAPRSTNRNALQREQELLKFNSLWVTMDPILEGPIEVANKAKIKFGNYVGLSKKPIQNHVSIPVNLVAGFFIYEGILEKIRKNSEQKNIELAKAGLTGMPYLKHWLDIQAITNEDLSETYNNHSDIIIKWLEKFRSKEKSVDSPPRMIQFFAEGLLKTEKEASEFENLLFNVVIDNAKEVSKAKRLGTNHNPDEFIKKTIIERLSKNPIFKSKTDIEKELLSLAFQPPIFVQKKELDFSWYRKIKLNQAKGFEEYSKTLHKFSDIYWLRKLLEAKAQQKPKAMTTQALKSISELTDAAEKTVKSNLLFNTAMKITLAAASASKNNEKVLKSKQQKLNSIKGFPKHKQYLGVRLDFPFFIHPQSKLIDIHGNIRTLKSEAEYWELLISHPSYRDILSQWSGGKNSDFETMQKVKLRLAETNQVHFLQSRLWTDAKKNGYKGNKPPPLSPKLYCSLRQKYKNNLFQHIKKIDETLMQNLHLNKCFAKIEPKKQLLINKMCLAKYLDGENCAADLIKMGQAERESQACDSYAKSFRKNLDFCGFALALTKWDELALEDYLWSTKKLAPNEYIMLDQRKANMMRTTVKKCLDPKIFGTIKKPELFNCANQIN